MMKVEVNANHYRAAQAHQSKEETRAVLNGVLLAKNGDIVATDGRSLFLAKKSISGNRPDEDIILYLDKTVPAKAESMIVDTDNGIVEYIGIGRVLGHIVEGPFPDYSGVLPADATLATEYSDTVILGTDQLLKLTKTFGRDASLYFRSNGVDNALTITCHEDYYTNCDVDYKDCLVVQMPMWSKGKRHVGQALVRKDSQHEIMESA